MVRLLLSLFTIFYLYVIHGEIDMESIVGKDLYKTLGIDPESNEKEIKRAYRKLAKEYHPDKAKPDQKEESKLKFTQIAEAYEVLSDPEQRRQYDSYRQRAARSTSRQNGYYSEDNFYDSRMGGGRRYSNDGAFNEDFNSLDNFPFDNPHAYEDDLRGSSHSFHNPVISESVIPSGTPLFPYSPVVISTDRSHFAFLDLECSLGVYKGDVSEFLNHLVSSKYPDLSLLPIEVRFRTAGDPLLQGRCFCGLDETGVLRVFRGHPNFPDSYPIWSSDPSPRDPYKWYTKRFFLELSNSGELSVRAWSSGSARSTPDFEDSDAECVWSSASCNIFFAVVKEFTGRSKNILVGAFDRFEEIITIITRSEQFEKARRLLQLMVEFIVSGRFIEAMENAVLSTLRFVRFIVKRSNIMIYSIRNFMSQKRKEQSPPHSHAKHNRTAARPARS